MASSMLLSTLPFHNSHLRFSTWRLFLHSPPKLLLRRPTSAMSTMFPQTPLAGDAIAMAVSAGVALSILRAFEQTAKRNVFDPVQAAVALLLSTLVNKRLSKVDDLLDLEKLNRKLVHISIGLVFMLCWPMFSSGHQGAIFAALVPAISIIKMLILGLGIVKDEAAVKSLSRYGDHRELLKGPLYYAATISLACAIYWLNSPIGYAAICNLCAGDGLADVIGRRFGSQKLPYNANKSIAGSIAMLFGGFLASVGFMFYFSSFGYMTKGWDMVWRFFVVSLASTLVESHPLSTDLDDNLTVPLTSLLVGSLVF